MKTKFVLVSLVLVLAVGIGVIYLRKDHKFSPQDESQIPNPSDTYSATSTDTGLAKTSTSSTVSIYDANTDVNTSSTNPPAQYSYTAPDQNHNDAFLDTSTSTTRRDLTTATPEQKERIAKTEAQAEYFAPTMRKTIALLKAANVSELVKMTHPQIISENGEEVIESSYTDYYVPFFADFTSIDEDEGTLSHYIPDEYSSNGMFYGESYKTPGGAVKNFVIAIVEWKGKPYIVRIDIDATIQDL